MKYYIESRGETDADARSLPTSLIEGQAYFNAETAARLEFQKHGRTNSDEYPMTVVIINGGNISRWIVELEAEPVFRASKAGAA